MQSQQISYRDTGFVSKMVCDLFEGKESLDAFYGNPPTLDNFKVQLIEKKENFSPNQREVLVSSLISQYSNLLQKGSPVDLNIERLTLSNTFTITTGHQLNLMTGPLYFLYKIISTLNLCKTLKKAHPDFNFVPLYWMATEDHDFEEISFFNFKGKNFKWNRNKAGAVGRFSLDGLEPLFTLFDAELGSSSSAQEIKNLIRESYLSSKSLTEATRKFVHQLFHSEGLVILDGDDRPLKQIFAPKMEEELRSGSCQVEVEKTISKLQLDYDSEYVPQVNPREINLFYLTKTDRLRLVRTASGFADADNTRSWTQAELLQELQKTPDRFSQCIDASFIPRDNFTQSVLYRWRRRVGLLVRVKSVFRISKSSFPHTSAPKCCRTCASETSR